MVLRTASELALWLSRNPEVQSLTLTDYQDHRLPALPPSLVSLSLYDCPQLVSLKAEVQVQTNLVKRMWQYSKSQGGDPLPHLRELWVYNCPNLAESFAFSPVTKNIAFMHCQSLRLPSLEHLQLTWLYLVDCPLVDCTALPQTEQLVVESCGFSIMPPLPQSLTLLHWRNTCTGLKRLAALPPELQILDIAEMPNLESLPALPATLEHFDISFCDGIKLLPDFSATQLYRFSVWNCAQIQVLPPLPATLAVLFVQECRSMRSLKLRRDLKMRIYHLNDCPVSVIQAFPERTCSIHLTNLPELTSMPEIGHSVRYSYINNCPQLQLTQPAVLDRQLRTTSGAFVDDPDWPD